MEVAALVQAAVAGVASGLSCYAALRVEMRWLRRDVDELRAVVFAADNRGEA